MPRPRTASRVTAVAKTVTQARWAAVRAGATLFMGAS